MKVKTLFLSPFTAFDLGQNVVSEEIAQQMLDVLISLGQRVDNGYLYCAECGKMGFEINHSPDCKLKAAIDAATNR